RRPNSWMSAGCFRRTLIQYALLWGNGLAWIRRNQAGDIIEMIPLLPDRSGMIRRGEPAGTLHGSDLTQVDGDLQYWTKVGDQFLLLNRDSVFHIKGLGFNGIWGWPVVELLAEAIGAAIAPREYSARLFGQGVMASGVIFMPGLKPEQQEEFAQGVSKATEGLGRAHRWMILEEGSQIKELSMTPEHAQMLQTIEFKTRDIANIVGVQQHKLGDPTRKSFNSLEQSNQEHLDDDLDPWLQVFEEEYEEKTLTREQRQSESHFVEFNRNAMMRTNLAARNAHYASGRQWGWFSANDIRRKENEDTIGDEGDIYLIPQNMMAAGQVARGVLPAGDPTAAAFHELSDREVARMVKWVTSVAQQKAHAGGAAFCEFLDALPNYDAPTCMSDRLAPLLARLKKELDMFTQPPFAAEDLAQNVAAHVDVIRERVLLEDRKARAV
ncbi:MAG: phage portal protein, partial [Pirellulales bacterium]|nr:phage portal protein [Pirellulales bacterium]